MTPHWIGHFRLPFLPATPSSLSQTLEGLNRVDCGVLQPWQELFTELQRNKDTVRCVVLVGEVPGPSQEQLTTLNWRVCRNTLLSK